MIKIFKIEVKIIFYHQNMNIEEKVRAIEESDLLTSEEKSSWVNKLKKADRRTEKFKKEFGIFYEELSNLVSEFNPINIPIDKENEDEYQLQVEEILNKIKLISSCKELEEAVVGIFIDGFYREIVEKRAPLYKKMSEAIWQLWQDFSKNRK